MTDKKKVDVKIDGRNFTIIGIEDEEYIKKLAEYVDEKIVSLSSKNDKLSQSMVSILSALHITDELFKMEEKYENLEEVSKEPLEQYDSLCEDLDGAKIKIEGLEKLCSEYQGEIFKYSSERDSLLEKIKKHEKELKTSQDNLKKTKSQMKKLQDKNFKNQVELIEVKKELEEYLKLLDSETSAYKDEKTDNLAF